MLPFKKRSKIHERYNLLSSQINPNIESITNGTAEQSTGEEYACFLRALTAPKSDADLKDNVVQPRSKTATNDNGVSKAEKVKHANGGNGLSAVMQMKAKNEESHKKRMKVIEDHMWQHKQEERELKRAEGDIIKKQRQLKNIMQEYEAAMYQKQRQEDLVVLQAANDLQRLKQETSVQDGKLTRERVDRNISELQKGKDRDRKEIAVLNSMEFQYEKIAEEIRKKRIEVESMTREFETKLRMKEEEEFKLEKELADMAVSINMVAQKQRAIKFDNSRDKNIIQRKDVTERRKREEEYEDKKNDSLMRGTLSERRQQKLAKDLDSTLHHTALKIREEGRKLTDVKSRLQRNSQYQRETQNDANYAAFNRQALDSDEKIKLVDARRAAIQNLITKERKQRGAQVAEEWKSRYFDKINETKRREVEDNVKHLQKFVSKQEEVEQLLYNQVKSCESERRKQEQNVESIRQELGNAKKENAKLLKETAFRCQKQEEELMQRLSREEAALKKALSQREERIRSFVKQRGFYQEEKNMLGKEQKIHDRLHRIGQKTDIIEQEMYS